MALFSVLTASTVTAQPTNADASYYGEVGHLALKFDDGRVSVTPRLARFTVGKNINENLAFEVMAALTVSKGKWREADVQGELSGKQLGIYVKPKLKITKDTEIFARVGVSHSSWKSNTATDENNDSFAKLAHGLGVQTQLTKDVYGQLDYMDLGQKNGLSAKGFSVSLGTRF